MGLWALAHFRAWASNTGDERVNLVKRLRNLAEFGLRDEFIRQDVGEDFKAFSKIRVENQYYNK